MSRPIMSRPRPLTVLLTLGAALAGSACESTGEGRSPALDPPHTAQGVDKSKAPVAAWNGNRPSANARW